MFNILVNRYAAQGDLDADDLDALEREASDAPHMPLAPDEEEFLRVYGGNRRIAYGIVRERIGRRREIERHIRSIAAGSAPCENLDSLVFELRNLAGRLPDDIGEVLECVAYPDVVADKLAALIAERLTPARRRAQ